MAVYFLIFGNASIGGIALSTDANKKPEVLKGTITTNNVLGRRITKIAVQY
jgi:hypothetical protein